VLAQYNDRPDELRCPFVIMFPEAVDADPIEARMVTPPCLSAAIRAMFWRAILDEISQTCQAAKAGASAMSQPSTPPMFRFRRLWRLRWRRSKSPDPNTAWASGRQGTEPYEVLAEGVLTSRVMDFVAHSTYSSKLLNFSHSLIISPVPYVTAVLLASFTLPDSD
jgi:hypothetical protein